MNARKGGMGALGALVFVGVAALMLVSMDRTVNSYDEGIMYAGAMRVADGAMIHRDFYANYGPAQFYLIALLFKVFHPAAFVARLWGCGIKALLVLVTFRVSRRITDPSTSAVGAAVAAVWLCIADTTIWPAWSALVLVLSSALCLMNVFDGKSQSANLFLAGLLIGLGALFRYDIGVLAFAAELTALGCYCLSRRWPDALAPGRALWDLRSFFLGNATIILPLLVWYGVAGALPDFLFDVVTFPAKNYAATRALPFPSLTEPFLLPASLLDYIVYCPVLIIPAALALLWHPARQIEPHAAPRAQQQRTGHVQTASWWSTLLLVLLTLVLFFKGIVRVSVVHMAPSVVVASILALTLRCPRGRPFTAGLAVLAALMLALPTLFALNQLGVQVGQGTDLLASLRSESVIHQAASDCETLRCSGRARFFRLDSSQASAVDYVMARSAPGEVIFSGLAHHDRVFANDVAFYFLSNRRPATKWYHFDPGLQTTPEIQRAIIADLKAKQPRLIVLNSSWDLYREPNASAISSGEFILDRFLANQYHTVARFGPISVGELEPESPEEAPRQHTQTLRGD